MKSILVAVSPILICLSAFVETDQNQLVPPIPIKMPLPWYPQNSTASGMVSLWVEVQKDGKTADVKVLKSIPSLDEPSIRSVKLWVFHPAKWRAADVGSHAIVNFVFGLDRKPSRWNVMHLKIVTNQKSDFPFPIEVYPINPPAPQTFSVIALVDESGRVSDLTTEGTVSLKRELLDLIKENWSFAPAHSEGKPVRSQAGITFAYVPFPAVEPFVN